MTPLRRIAFIGNSLPRRCGIATFTTDLQQAISTSRPNLETCIVAMTDHGQAYDYPSSVALQIKDDNIEEYVRAADFLNAGRFDTVCLQHEFGIFGGEAGAHILALLSRLTMPVVTTLHTVLAKPTAAQRAVMERIVEVSSKVVVMANKGRELLRSVYQVPDDKIEVIAHGIPDVAFVGPDAAKAKLGFGGKSVILTFGLLSPNKGIEVMIDAMPSILKRRPDAVYVVLGATHPNLVRDQGEAYRESLMARVRELGIEDHVVFLDQFVDQATLLEFISMCDVYVTPYLNEAQMTSGTLAYSFGLGKPVVSTPYWHARELLADGRGVLVPFGDAAAIGSEIAELLTDDARRQAMCRRAYAVSRSMTWERTAERYMSAFENARQGHWLKVVARSDMALPEPRSPAAPDMQIGHFLSMCDDTGLFQHAVHSVPDRSHGYCVDDNARALLLACALNEPGEQPLSEVLTARFAAFVQHAWNPDTRRFRNFMGFSRIWLEDSGSEDSHGRTLWALGECARSDSSPSRRSWAASLFAEALPTAEAFRSPRAWAFTLLGLDAYCAAASQRSSCRGSPARSCRQADGHSRIGRDAGLGVVRGRACLRQRAPAAGLDRDGHGNANTRLCRCRIEIPALADDAANGIGRAFPPRRHGRLRRTAATSPRLRSAARGSHGHDRRLPHGVAGGWRCRVESPRNARFRVVSRQQRSVGCAGRSADRQLPRWTASRSRQRKSRRRVGRVLSAWACGDSSACARQRRPDKTRGTARRRRLNFTSHSSEPRTPCHKPPS